jgi:predicted nicotinamide N-methyase
VILELGAGTGLLSRLLVQIGAKKAIATDMKDALEVLRENTKKFGKIEVRGLDWGESLPQEEKIDYIFIADCVYGGYDLDSLLVTLKTRSPQSVIICGYKPRVTGVEKKFFHKLKGRVKIHETPAEYLSTNVEIMEIV